jgi:ELWxxDGT repeat protein
MKGQRFSGVGGMGSRSRRRSGTMSQRRRREGLGRGLGVEPLEVRALLSGQTVQLIKDVNTVLTYPQDLTPAGPNLYYEAEDSSHQGVELAVTNASGTQVLLDTGSGSSYSSLSDLTAVGSDIFFYANTPSGNVQLFTSDGTAAGTVPASPEPIAEAGLVSGLTAVGNSVVFETTELGVRASATTLDAASLNSSSISDLLPSSDESFSLLGVVNNELYLSVDGDLWTTDGTSAGTQELYDSSSNPIPAPGRVFAYLGQVYYTSYSSSTQSSTIGILGADGETPTVSDVPLISSGPVVAGSLFYFTASSSGNATQLWASDGTQANTRMIEDFSSISPTSAPTHLVDADGTLFFTVDGSDGDAQLWTSDGTSAGTEMVLDLGLAGASAYSGLLPVGGTLYFAADDGTHGDELWSDDVATGMTQMVADIDPGPAGSDPTDLVDWNGQVAFVANDGDTPLTSQVWTSLGTAATTSLLASSPGLDGSAVPMNDPYAATGSLLLLPLDDGIHGTSLWATDGTAADTQMVSPVDPSHFGVLDGTVYFLGAGPGLPFGLWTTDGTAAGTTEVMDLSQYGPDKLSYGLDLGEMAASGSLIYFTTSDGNDGVDLWASDGTAGGTSLVMDFPKLSQDTPGGYQGTVSDMTPFEGKLAFIAHDGSQGTQLWITDGTVSGTQMLTDLAPPYDGSSYSGVPQVNISPSDLMAAGGTLYFIARTPGAASGTSGLWTSDGTAAGTSELFSFPSLPNPIDSTEPTITAYAANLTAVGSNLFFSLEYYNEDEPSDPQYQLWTSDGTASGTVQVPAPPYGTFSDLFGFMAMGDQLLFQAVESYGTELWASDGTAAGTTELKFLSASTSPYGTSDSSNNVDDDGIIYFAAEDGTDGTELWQTNGTPAGTFPVADINPGPASSNPIPLAVLNGHVVLAANDGLHGNELMEVASTSQTTAPQIATIPTQQASVGDTFQLALDLYASDPNEPVLPLTYSLGSDAPPGMTIDASTGLVTWPGASDQTTGPYSFTVTVSDNSSPALTASATIMVNVNAPQPPAFATIPTQDVTVGETLSLDLSQFASDPNFPPLPLTYSLGANPPSGVSITPAGLLTWAIPSTMASGDYSVPVIATDDGTPQRSTDTTITVDVTPIKPPSIGMIPGLSANPGQTLYLDLSQYVTDENSPALPLTYALTGGPAGASLNPTTGLFTWVTPANQPLGVVTFTFQVYDSLTSASPTQGSITFDVGSPTPTPTPTAPPVLRTVGDVLAATGQTLTFDVASLASDPNTPALPLTYSLYPGAPAGVSINPTTGVLTWNVPATQRIGIYPVTVIVSDNSSPPKTAYETIDLSVVDPSPPPTISTPTVSTKKGFSITFSFSVPVDPATASNPANYILTEAPRQHQGQKKTPAPRVIKLIVSYDAATNQVTLKAAKKPKAGMVLTLTVVGAGGIAKLDGLQLAGAGTSGTNYVVTITGKRISHTAAVVKRATTSAAPGGPLSMARTPFERTVILGTIPTGTGRRPSQVSFTRERGS